MNYGLAGPAPGNPVGAPGPKPESPTPQVVMNGDTLRRTVTVADPQGLHMRPAARFAKRARDFQSAVTVRRDDRAANGKSQLELVLLAAEQGMPLILEVAGDDAAEALAVLGDVLAAACCDDDDAGPPPKG